MRGLYKISLLIQGVRSYYRDVSGGAAVCGRPSFGVGRFVSVSGPGHSVGCDALKLTCDPVCSDAGLDV